MEEERGREEFLDEVVDLLTEALNTVRNNGGNTNFRTLKQEVVHMREQLIKMNGHLDELLDPEEGVYPRIISLETFKKLSVWFYAIFSTAIVYGVISLISRLIIN